MFSDEIIGLALWHNVVYAAGTVAGKIVLSLLLALLLNQALRGRSFLSHGAFLAGGHVVCRRRHSVDLAV